MKSSNREKKRHWTLPLVLALALIWVLPGLVRAGCGDCHLESELQKNRLDLPMTEALGPTPTDPCPGLRKWKQEIALLEFRLARLGEITPVDPDNPRSRALCGILAELRQTRSDPQGRLEDLDAFFQAKDRTLHQKVFLPFYSDLQEENRAHAWLALKALCGILGVLLMIRFVIRRRAREVSDRRLGFGERPDRRSPRPHQ